MKYYIIVNPTSGRGYGGKSIPEIQAFFQENFSDFTLVKTEAPGHAIQLSEAAVQAGFDVIVSAGGDGTANEVLNGISQANETYQKDACMAVIPVGRGNDFAFSMGIPAGLINSLACIKADYQKRVDLGRVVGPNFPNGRLFGNGVGIGFDAVVGFEALKLKPLSGFASYILAALKTIFLYYNPPELEIHLPKKTLRGKYLMVSIMNGIRMGGGFFMAPQGNPSDHVFDLCIVDNVSKMATFPLISKFMSGSQGGDPAVNFEQADKVSVTAIQGKIPAHADGETVCENGDTITVELLHDKMKIITSKPEQG